MSEQQAAPANLEEWTALEREGRRSVEEVCLDLEHRSNTAVEVLGLEGPLIAYLIHRRPILLPVKRWGGDLGWRSARRRSSWERMLGRPASADGLLLRCEVAAEQWVPNPDVPANWAMDSFQAFARYVADDEASYERARALRAENRSVLNERLSERLKDLGVELTARYHRYGGGAYIDIALLRPDNAEDPVLRINPVWKGESALAALVRTYFPDAVREHTEPWLSGQRLDVYVPSHRLALEYQGEQHFRAVDYFGGKEAFRRNRDRDRRKAAACHAHGITLVEWRYSEPVTQERLRSKLLNAGIAVPETLRS